MFSKHIGIDLGTVNILIYEKGQGIVLDEPSIVVIDENTKKIIAYGLEANEMLGRTPGKIKAIRPLKDGVIADFEVMEQLLGHLLKKVKVKSNLFKPQIVICCPTNITEVEKNAIGEIAQRTGAKKVYVEEEPKVAAIGAGLDIAKPIGNMVIDIGGGTTDIAVLSLGDIVTSTSLRVAGNTFDENIVSYIKDKYKLLIGEKTAERVKLTIGTAYKGIEKDILEIRGRDLIGGLPKTITINALEIEEALKESITKIINMVKAVLEQTPPELAADIIERGIVLTGGGALLKNLPQLLEKELQVPVYLAEEPLKCVAIGTGIFLDQLARL